MSRFEKWSVWASAALTSVTGVGLLWAKYLMESTDPWAVVNHPLQPWLLKVHIVAAPFLVFSLGLIAVRHVWSHFRNGLQWGRRSGIITALVTLPMVATGYLIQAITHPLWLGAMAFGHIAVGLVFTVGLSLHQLFVRQRAGEREVRGIRGGDAWRPGDALGDLAVEPLRQATNASPPARPDAARPRPGRD